MTEQTATSSPKTIQLGPRQWQVLAVSNAAELVQTLQNMQAAPNDEMMKVFDDHMAQLKVFLVAWRKFSPPVPAQVATDPASGEQAQPNGAAAPKKHAGGWPKGKSRKAKSAAAQPLAS